MSSIVGRNQSLGPDRVCRHRVGVTGASGQVSQAEGSRDRSAAVIPVRGCLTASEFGRPLRGWCNQGINERAEHELSVARHLTMQPSSNTGVLQLEDGRRLAWIEIGDPKGLPVLAFHGSPGVGTLFTLFHAVATQCGVRLIAPDRPGYGSSSFQPKRRLRDWPSDVRQLASHLGAERFAVIGHSAGGPHALACARFLPERVLGCGILSGVASQAETRMTEGMMTINRIQVAVYRHWRPSFDAVAAGLWWLTKPIAEPALMYGRRHPDRGLDRMLTMMPVPDVAVMSRPDVRAELLAEAAGFTSAVLRTSVQDMAIGFRDWGFRLEDISLPVHFWHGELDRNVPVSHAYYQARSIPGAALHLCTDEGHWLLADHMAEILDTVTREPG